MVMVIKKPTIQSVNPKRSLYSFYLSHVFSQISQCI